MESYLSNFLKKLPVNVYVDVYFCNEFVEPFKFERISSNDYEKFINDDYIIMTQIKNNDGSYELDVCK